MRSTHFFQPDSPRKTRKRAAVSPAAEEGEASKTAGPCEDALKTTAEPFEPKKKQPKSDDSSEPKTKAPKKDQSSEPTKKEPKARHSFEPKKKPLKADGSFEQKEKTLKDESSSGLKGKQPKADEKSYESRLIAAVRRQPGLYDPQHVDYLPKNMGKKNVALWTTVGNEIGVTGTETKPA